MRGDTIDEKALKALIRTTVALNTSVVGVPGAGARWGGRGGGDRSPRPLASVTLPSCDFHGFTAGSPR